MTTIKTIFLLMAAFTAVCQQKPHENQHPMKLQSKSQAKNFTALEINGEQFTLSTYSGKKIFLAFFRNGACALCNLRVHELIMRYDELKSAGIEIVAVFESSIEDMAPYVGKQDAPFILLSDPKGILYQLYGAETSPEKINAVLQNNTASERIKEAAEAGFQLTPQTNANFFRLPAEFLIDEHFTIQKAFYSEHLTDYIEIEDILKFGRHE